MSKDIGAEIHVVPIPGWLLFFLVGGGGERFHPYVYSFNVFPMICIALPLDQSKLRELCLCVLCACAWAGN